MWVIPFYPCMLPATVVSQSSSSGANATELWFREKNVFIHMCSHSHSVNYNSTAKSTFKISLNLSLHLIIVAVNTYVVLRLDLMRLVINVTWLFWVDNFSISLL